VLVVVTAAEAEAGAVVVAEGAVVVAAAAAVVAEAAVGVVEPAGKDLNPVDMIRPRGIMPYPFSPAVTAVD
jgi:hypothetical protein